VKLRVKLLWVGLVVVSLCVFGVSGLGLAQEKAGDSAVGADTKASTNAPKGQYKIGIVDVQAVMDGYTKREEEVGKLENEVKELQEQIDALDQEFQDKKQKYDETKESLTEEERIEWQEQLETAWFNLKSEYTRISDQIKAKEQRLRSRLLADIMKCIEEIGVKENFHLILEAEKTSRTGVLFYSATMDITDKVIVRLNGSES